MITFPHSSYWIIDEPEFDLGPDDVTPDDLQEDETQLSECGSVEARAPLGQG